MTLWVWYTVSHCCLISSEKLEKWSFCTCGNNVKCAVHIEKQKKNTLRYTFQIILIFSLAFYGASSNLWYKTQSSKLWNCWSLSCSWSTDCRRSSNYIFIFHSTTGFNGLGKDICQTRREHLSFGIGATCIRGSTILITLFFYGLRPAILQLILSTSMTAVSIQMMDARHFSD